MSVNKNRPHVMVLPEDDANSSLANGFILHPDLSDRQIQVLPVAGGWIKTVERFKSDHVSAMTRYRDRTMVLLIDFDGNGERLGKVKAVIPEDLKDRVFVLGVWTEPEALRDILGSYEKIGLGMAEDCHDDTTTTWGHKLLQHNSSELERLRQRVRPILFPSI